MVEIFSFSVTYPPSPRCIYCGRKPPEAKLTLEHIIPIGLKGYLKLPDGSCTDCADITKKFEQRVLREMFGFTRIHTGLGWGRKKERPRTAPVKIKTEDGFKLLDVSISEHPFALTMLMLPPPGMLGSATKVEHHRSVRAVFRGIQSDTQERVDRLSDTGVRIEQVALVPEFWRLLAKIAHGFAAAEIGLNAFRPYLLDIITGNLNGAANLIGGPDEFVPPSPRSGRSLLHDIWLYYAYSRQKPRQKLIIAAVHLFACYEMPIHQVVVGEPTATGQ